MYRTNPNFKLLQIGIRRNEDDENLQELKGSKQVIISDWFLWIFFFLFTSNLHVCMLFDQCPCTLVLSGFRAIFTRVLLTDNDYRIRPDQFIQLRRPVYHMYCL